MTAGPKYPSPASSIETPDINETVATNIARHRATRGLSLAKLAEISGVSRAMLNQIERRQSVPTISVLWKIANAFEMPFSSLLARPMDAKTTVLTKRHAWSLTSQNGAFVSRALFPLAGPRNVEFYELRLEPGVEEAADAHASGTLENIVVHQGRLAITVEDTPYELQTGDAIEFRADVPHRYRNLDDNETIAFLVMTYQVGPSAEPR
ncbi:MAG: XRE family transcriptional regulator [Myxococcota bacterium]